MTAPEQYSLAVLNYLSEVAVYERGLADFEARQRHYDQQQRALSPFNLKDVSRDALESAGCRTSAIYVSRAFRDYLGMVGIKHILATPFHPQTSGKLERYQQTLKQDVNQLPYEMPSDLEAAIVAFVSYYNYRRYHKALGNVTPSDVLKGRHHEILRRRKEVQAQTIQRRRQHNRALRELTRPHSDL